METKTPLACKLERPTCFSLHRNCLSNSFVNSECYLPRGLEREGQDMGDVKRPKAPLPATGAVPGVSFMKSQALDGFVCAEGVSFYRSFGDHARLNGGHMAKSIEAELKLHSDLKKKNDRMIGPHESQPPRGCAVTLLLPRAAGGRLSTNAQDLIYLNALTRIAESPVCGAQRSEREKSAPAVAAATKVRVGVLAGKDDVASFLSGCRTYPSDNSWTKSSALSVSYVDGDAISVAYVPLDDVRSSTIELAIKLIQERFREVQIQSGKSIVLPPPFLSMEDVSDLSDWEENSGAPLPFLEHQATLQNRFKEIYFSEPVVEAEDNLGIYCITSSGGRPLRIVSRAREYQGELDQEHSIGYLFADDRSLMETYLLRCRESVASSFNKANVTFGLYPLNPDEQSARIVVFWFKVRPVYIGNNLSLFASRVPSVMGTPLTNMVNSFTQQIVPMLSTVDDLLKSEMAIPCTDESIVLARSPTQTALTNAFSKISLESFNALKMKINSMNTQARSPAPAPAQEGDMEAENDVERELAADYSAVMGCLPGHPCTTIGDAYAALEKDFEDSMLSTYSFHYLLTSGIAKFGPETTLESLFSKCSIEDADAERSRSASPKKRKTPTPSPRVLEDDQRILLFQMSDCKNREHFANMLGCSKTSAPENVEGTSKTACLKIIWSLLGHEAKSAGEKDVRKMIKGVLSKASNISTETLALSSESRELVDAFALAAIASLTYSARKEVFFVVRGQDAAVAFRFVSQGGEWTPMETSVLQTMQAIQFEKDPGKDKKLCCVVWMDCYPQFSYATST